jgi:hypothetical protein
MTAKIFAGCAGRCGALFRPERNDSAKQEPRAATSSARRPPTGCASWRRPVAAASSCRGPCSSLRAGRFGVLKQGRAPPRAMAIVENHDRCGVDVPLKRRGAEGSSASRRSNAACKSPKNAGFCALTLFVFIVTTATWSCLRSIVHGSRASHPSGTCELECSDGVSYGRFSWVRCLSRSSEVQSTAGCVLPAHRRYSFVDWSRKASMAKRTCYQS